MADSIKTESTGTGGGGTVVINIPDYTPLFKQLIQIAGDVTTATIVPSATFSTTGTLGLFTVSNTVTTIGSILVGMVLNGTDVKPGTVVLSKAPNGPTWSSWYVSKPQNLISTTTTGLTPVVSMAANASEVANNVRILTEKGITANTFSWTDIVKTYSWYIQDDHKITPEKFAEEFEKFVIGATSVTNKLPRFL